MVVDRKMVENRRMVEEESEEVSKDDYLLSRCWKRLDGRKRSP